MPIIIRGRRAGTTLAELAIALMITGLAGLIGVGLLAAAERRTHADGAADRVAQAARDVAHVLGADISGADPAHVAVRGDTALDLGAHVGVSVACVAAGHVLVVPGARTSLGAPFTVWRLPPERSDIVLVWDTLAATWRETIADSVTTRTDGAGCPANGPFRSIADSVANVPVIRLRLADSLPGAVGAGAPVRVVREVRWTLYRSSDRNWWLGYRRCPAGACGAAQPVAGPLAAPGDSGLVFARGSQGTVTVTTRPPRDGGSARSPLPRVWAIRGARDGHE